MTRSRTRLIRALLIILVIASGAVILRLRSDNPQTEQQQSHGGGTGADDSLNSELTTRTRPRTPVANASPSSDDASQIEVFFSNSYGNDPAIGSRDPGNIDRRLCRFITSAERSIDGAFFEIESERIADALIDAHKRGIRVRLVIEDDYAGNADIQRLKSAGIPIVHDDRSGLMHNKFLVVDSFAVWTGSFNATDNGAVRNNNNAVIVRSPEVAENFEAEFEEMFARREFGPRSTSNTPHTLVKLAGSDIYTYFSPEDDVPPKILRFLRAAQSRIRFMAFSFTDDSIGVALVRRHAAGVEVEGIVERRGAELEYSELKRLRTAGITVMTDGNPYALHHKVMIIDDKWVILGSYNFTASAAERNDENILIIRSPDVARQFNAEYDRIKSMAAERM